MLRLDHHRNASWLQGLLDRPDEIGQLANVFNEMAEQVDGREQGLQRQVTQLQRDKERKQREHLNSIQSSTTNTSYTLIQRAQALRKELQIDRPESL